MSITPYNNFTVRDLSGIQQPYVNSSREVGYFRGTSVGTIPQNRWRSLQAVLNTNNGIASVDASGLTILNPGVYSIKLSLFPTSTQDVSSNISFNFGTRYLFDVSTNVVADSFGGVCPTGMFTYDASNDVITPGIITWVADGYSSGNTGSNFIKTQTDELSFNYSTAGTGEQIFSGICTTEITFILNIPRTIYFNVSGNSTTVTMGNCIFTLQLISNYYFPPLLIWTPRGVSNNLPATAVWTSITSSSDGVKLAATVGGTIGTTRGIYTSINSGASWLKSDASNNVNWVSIASSSDGVKLAAVASGTGIYTSTNSGANWVKRDASNNNWTSITSSSDGINLAAVASGINGINSGGGIYTSGDSGLNWVKQNTGIPANTTWLTTALSSKNISSSSSGQHLVVVLKNNDSSNKSIYRSSNFGASWVGETGNSGAVFYSVASDSTGKYLVLGGYNGFIGMSTDYGASFTANESPGSRNWLTVASDSTGRYLAAAANGVIYTSFDFGSNWTLQPTGATSANWTSIASSSSVANLAAVANNLTIYTGVYQ